MKKPLLVKNKFDEENIEINETIIWYTNRYGEKDIRKLSTFFEMKTENKKKDNIYDHFIDRRIVNAIQNVYSILDHCDQKRKKFARNRSNVFENVKHNIFVNRDGVKMANIDSALDFMFTTNDDISENELYYYADINGGPGGFVEYILWRKQWRAKIYGYSSPIFYAKSEFCNANTESFDVYNEVKHMHITDPKFISSFSTYIMKHSDMGVHYLLSSDRINTAKNVLNKEIHCKQSFLCQCIIALNIVRPGGHFLMQLFDTHTKFTIGLIYLMHYCFESVTIFKPKASRPANNERYFVCNKRKDLSVISVIRDHLLTVNAKMESLKKSEMEVTDIIAIDFILEDKEFVTFIRNMNDSIARTQLFNLEKIMAYYKNSNLQEMRKDEIRKKCLVEWQLPDVVREKSLTKSTTNYLQDLFVDWNTFKAAIMDDKPEFQLKKTTNLKKLFQSHSWNFVACENNQNSKSSSRTFYMSKGGKLIYKYKSGKFLKLLNGPAIELAPMTVVYGEFCTEYNGRLKQTAFHIIDGVVLGGIDIRNRSLSERHKMCEIFAKSMNKTCKQSSNDVIIPIRGKRLYKMTDFKKLFNEMAMFDGFRRLSVGNGDPKLNYSANCILFLNDLSPNFIKMYPDNQKADSFIYLNKLTKKAFSKEVCAKVKIEANFEETFATRCMWDFEFSNHKDGLLNHKTLLEFILTTFK